MLERLLINFYSPSAKASTLTISAVLLCQASVAWLVYATGGVKFVTPHTMYLPVIVAALVFGIRGGVLSGLAGGFLLGPYMPLDTATGETQELYNWLYRLAYFCAVGGIVGAGVGVLRGQLTTLAWMNDHDARSGLLGRTGLLKAM